MKQDKLTEKQVLAKIALASLIGEHGAPIKSGIAQLASGCGTNSPIEVLVKQGELIKSEKHGKPIVIKEHVFRGDILTNEENKLTFLELMEREKKVLLDFVRMRPSKAKKFGLTEQKINNEEINNLTWIIFQIHAKKGFDDLPESLKENLITIRRLRMANQYIIKEPLNKYQLLQAKQIFKKYPDKGIKFGFFISLGFGLKPNKVNTEVKNLLGQHYIANLDVFSKMALSELELACETLGRRIESNSASKIYTVSEVDVILREQETTWKKLLTATRIKSIKGAPVEVKSIPSFLDQMLSKLGNSLSENGE